MKYRVTITFEKGPDFKYELRAKNDTAAKAAARREAPNYGYTEKVKSVTAMELG